MSRHDSSCEVTDDIQVQCRHFGTEELYCNKALCEQLVECMMIRSSASERRFRTLDMVVRALDSDLTTLLEDAKRKWDLIMAESTGMSSDQDEFCSLQEEITTYRHKYNTLYCETALIVSKMNNMTQGVLCSGKHTIESVVEIYIQEHKRRLTHMITKYKN